jgi:hypothetical protein
MTALHPGDPIRFAHYDPIHGRFELVGEVAIPVYDDGGVLERVQVAVDGRSAVIKPCQILDPIES